MNAELAQAQRLLHGDGVVAHQALRAACWVLRSTLERTLRDLVAARGVELGQATSRSALTCLEVLYEETAPNLAGHVKGAWARLSRAVHHDAYELSPTLIEVRDLAEAVAVVVDFAAQQGRSD